MSDERANVYDLEAKRRALEARERTDRAEPELPLKAAAEVAHRAAWTRP